jgi:hypothetical protein
MVCSIDLSNDKTECFVMIDLSDDELPLGVEAWHEVGVYEVRALLVVRGLQLHPAVVVRQDVRKPDHRGRSLYGST